MGNLFSKKQPTKYERLPSVWGYKGVDSTINGLFLSSVSNEDGTFVTHLYRQDENGNRFTVWVRITSVNPTAIEIFYRENEPLRVVFMIGEEHAGIDDVVWETNEFKMNEQNNTLIFMDKKNKKSSPSQSANGAGASSGGPEVSPDATYPNGLPVNVSRQVASGSVVPFRRPVSDVNPYGDFRLKEPDRTSSVMEKKTVITFSGMGYVFTVLDDLAIVYNQIKCFSPHNTPMNVQLGIINISSLKVYELLTGVYLIVIQTTLGQTYLSGYLSTNTTPSFATFKITSNLEEKRFQSFEHVLGTVFTCFFSDGTQKTFSIESGSYATITEVLDA